VGITEAPNEIFGKIMSIPDTAIASYLTLSTFTPLPEVEMLVKELQSGKAHPKEVKMNLAQQIVEIYHGRKEGENARDYFVSTFQKKELPSDMPTVTVKKETPLVDVLVNEKFVTSKSDFRRLLDEGALRKDGETKITDPLCVIDATLVLKIGKHRFLKIIVEE
jgi:tyrosyl-tRNA synthetase